MTAVNRFGVCLKQARKNSGWSQQYLAKKIGVSRITISRWEKGIYFPLLYYREKLCEMFNQTMDELFPFDTEILEQISIPFPLEFQQIHEGMSPELQITSHQEKPKLEFLELRNQFPLEIIEGGSGSLEDALTDQKVPLRSCFDRGSHSHASEDHPPRLIHHLEGKSFLDSHDHVDNQIEKINRYLATSELYIKYLEVYKKYVDITVDIVNKIMDVLEPKEDLTFKVEVLKKLLLEFPSFDGEEQNFPVPTPQHVIEVIEELRAELTRIKTLQEMQNTKNYTITTKDAKIAIDHFDDTLFLAACALSQARYVSAQLETGDQMQSKGIIVQEFLKRGFEQIRPSGARSDLAPEWRFYNILYYRYFRHSLKSEQIAARLAISIRQFFRERDRALALLTQQLQTIEAQVPDQTIIH